MFSIIQLTSSALIKGGCSILCLLLKQRGRHGHWENGQSGRFLRENPPSAGSERGWLDSYYCGSGECLVTCCCSSPSSASASPILLLWQPGGVFTDGEITAHIWLYQLHFWLLVFTKHKPINTRQPLCVYVWARRNVVMIHMAGEILSWAGP